MASSVAEPETCWWGAGAEPTERWPGVTIPLDDCGGKYTFDAAKADRVCDWFPKYCSHSKGEYAGQKFALLDYQRALILRPLFGWVDDKGLRRFRKAFIEIPKKNGKTQLIAGLALYMLLADNEPGAEVYVAAADRDQARILFSAAKAMVEASPALTKRLQVYSNYIARKDDPSAFFKVLSAEAATKHGPNIHCLIIDELHAQPDRELFETLTRGVIARKQPLTILITTAGDDDESICHEEYDYAKRVLSGTIQDDRFLPVVFEAGKDDDPFDEATWRKVNPALGETVELDVLAGMATEAKNEPRKLNDFRRYHLNQWTNQATAWIPLAWWDACDAPLPDDAILKELSCAGGLDMSLKWDLTCFMLCFRERMPGGGSPTQAEVKSEDGAGNAITRTIDLNYRVFLLPFFWIPEETMREHENADGVPYSVWAERGLIIPTAGGSVHYTRIYSDIITKIVPRFPRLKQGVIGYDAAFTGDIAGELQDRGRLTAKEVPQIHSHLNEPAQVFEALVKTRQVVHGGHRVLRNHMEHVEVKTDGGGRIKPVKPKNQRKHIDGVVAALMGLKALAEVPDRRPKAGAFWA